MRLMKTIFASSPHCSVFRCQAFTAIDLLLKNKYVMVGVGWGMTATSFILNLSRKTPLFSVQLRIFFLFARVFQEKKKIRIFFSCLSVTQKLSRCVWVLIRCAQPILLFAMKRTKGISDFFFVSFQVLCPPHPAKKYNLSRT